MRQSVPTHFPLRPKPRYSRHPRARGLPPDLRLLLLAQLYVLVQLVGLAVKSGRGLLGGKGCLLKEQSREHAWHVPRLCQPSIITCGRRYTRVCKVRVAQCVYIAQSGSESQTSIEQAPIFVLGCEAPLVPGVSGVSGVWLRFRAYGLGVDALMNSRRKECMRSVP